MRKSLKQLFEEFMFETEFATKVSSETLRGYKHAFYLFSRLMPETSIQSISSTHVLQFFKTLQERKRLVGKGQVKVGVKKSTVATYWSKLNVFFQWLVTKKYLIVNPCASIRYPSPTYEDRQYLQKHEVEKIITAIHTHHYNNLLILKRNLVLFYLLLFCGLRKGELLQLQVRDIDFEKRMLSVRADTSKSGKSRSIPLHSSLLLYLKDYFATRKKYTTPYLIVSSRHDERLTDDGLKHLIKKLSTTSHVRFHVHQLRHTFAVNFLKTNNNIAKLKQLLGHKSIAMTLVYVRCLPTDEMRADIENMSVDALL